MDDELKSNIERRRQRIAEKTSKVQTEYYVELRKQSKEILKKKKPNVQI